MTRKRIVYISGDDAPEWDADNVGMSSAPFPNHLRAWREFRHKTQEELADAVGCSKATIGHLESGARRLSDKWLHPIAKELRTKPGYIVDHDPNDLPTDILDTWAAIPEVDRPRALQILKAFERTGTDG